MTEASIIIGDDSRSLNDNYESWLNEKIREAQDQGKEPSIIIKLGGLINLELLINCSSDGGRGRGRFSSQQQEIIDLWQESRASECPVKFGLLNAFLKRLRKLL